jgi:hypothetical protein
VSEPCWSDQSLALLQARLAQRWCRSRACRKLLRRRTGQSGYAGARGFCQACYERLWDAGFPAEVPERKPHGDRWEAARLAQSEIRASKVEEFAMLTRMGVPAIEAARRVGVSAKTGYAYAAEIRQQRREGVAA